MNYLFLWFSNSTVAFIIHFLCTSINQPLFHIDGAYSGRTNHQLLERWKWWYIYQLGGEAAKCYPLLQYNSIKKQTSKQKEKKKEIVLQEWHCADVLLLFLCWFKKKSWSYEYIQRWQGTVLYFSPAVTTCTELALDFTGNNKHICILIITHFHNQKHALWSCF